MQRFQACRRSIHTSHLSLRSFSLGLRASPSVSKRFNIPLSLPSANRTLHATAYRPSDERPRITSRLKDEIVNTAPPAPPSILDRLPSFAKPIRPYLELTRIDKPIGTLLLYWPCGTFHSNDFRRGVSSNPDSSRPQHGQSQWLQPQTISLHRSRYSTSRSSAREPSSCAVRDVPSMTCGTRKSTRL